MTPTLDKMQMAFKEQLTFLQTELEKLESNISQTEQFLEAKPDHKPTLNRYNLLCHNRSVTKAKIRKLKERMK